MQHRSVLQYGTAGVIIALFVISAVFVPNNQPVVTNNLDSSLDPMNSPQISTSGSESQIIGAGNNQTMRIDMENSSIAQLQNIINITSASNEEYLSYGQFNFSLPQSLNTTYVLEDDNSLKLPYKKTDVHTKEVVNSTGKWVDGVVSNLNTESNYITFNTTEKAIIVNITANYSLPGWHLENIIGFLSELRLSINVSALLNISLYDWTTSTWTPMITELPVNNTLTMEAPITYKSELRNENLRFFNSTIKNASFSFIIYNNTQNDFTARFYYLKLDIAEGHELSLSTGRTIALEFDLKGNSTIRGFNLWLRAKGIGASINLNASIVGTTSNLYQKRSILLDKTISLSQKISPDYSKLYRTQNFTIESDKPTWYNYNNPVDLPIGNYFILLESDNIDANNFSLVVLPDFTSVAGMGYDDDGLSKQVDHLLMYKTAPANWTYTYIGFISDTSYICDAAPFSLNLTRAWLPSEINLTIADNDNNLPVSGTFNSNYAYDIDNRYAADWWGLGKVTFSRSYEQDGIKAVNDNFSLTLNWNTNNLTSLNYNLTYYVKKYVFSNATSIFVLNLNKNPQWNVTYPLTKNLYPGWNVTTIGCYYAKDWSLINAYDANNQVNRTFFMNVTFGSKNMSSYVRFNGNMSFLIDGNYTYIFSSPNYISKARTYINYLDNLWESPGFMQGDNVSMRVGVLNPVGGYVSNNGVVNLTIYNTTNQLIHTYVDSSIDQLTDACWYDFGKINLLNTSAVVKGNYTIVSYWTDMNQAGIISNNFFIDRYEILTPNFMPNYENNVTQVAGLINLAKTDLEYYDLFYFVSTPITNDYITNLGGDYLLNKTTDISLGYDISITRMCQNETIFNGGETVKFNITLQNSNMVLKYNVSLIVSLVSSINEKWVIANATSQYKTLNISGNQAGDDLQSYIIDLNLPTRAQGGLNCPIRNAPVQIKVELKINDLTLESNLFDELYPFIDDITNDGNLSYVGLLEDRVGRPYLANIPRNTLKLPGNSTIIINALNNYGMTDNTEKKFIRTESISSLFENLTASNTFNLNKTSTLNISGVLITEKGDALNINGIKFSAWNTSSDTEISIELLNGGNTVNTNAKGEFLGQIPMAQFNTSEILLRVSWIGNIPNSILGCNKNITLKMNSYLTNCSISYIKEKLVIDSNNFYTLTFKNTGNSTIENFTFNIGTNSDFSGEIVQISADRSSTIYPGEETVYRIRLWNSNFRNPNATIYFEIQGVVLELNETYTQEFVEVINVYGINEEILQNVGLVLGYFAIAVTIWGVGILYMRKQYLTLNRIPGIEPTEEKVKGTKTGKYINIKDLSTDKQPSKDESPKPEGSTTLDDLIKEEGIDNKNK